MEYRNETGLFEFTDIFSLFINDLISYLRSGSDSEVFTTNEIEDVMVRRRYFLLRRYRGRIEDISCFADSVARLHLKYRLIDLIEKFCKSLGITLNLTK